MSAQIRGVTRRSWLTGLGLAAGGLALGVFERDALAEPAPSPASPGPQPRPGEAAPAAGELAPNVFVHVAPDGLTTIVCHRSEMGQGVRSSLPLVMAAELGADPARVVVHQATGDEKYGDQNTDGSTSIRKGLEHARQAAAAVRTLLVAAAARRWRVKPEACVAEDHQIKHPPSGRALAFADLVAEAAKLPVPKASSIVLRPDAELRARLPASPPLLDGQAYVDGSAVYGADVTLPGQLVAVIARPPVVGGAVAKYDAEAALRVPGVKKVVAMPAPREPWLFQPWGGVAVVAENTWAALKGREALVITWEDGANAVYDSEAFRGELLASVRAPGTTVREVGDVDAALAAAASVVEAEYVVPHLAHLTMEPPAALARVEGGHVEVWAPSQDPQTVRESVAQIVGVEASKVTIHVTLLGGGFGRKSKADFACEAAFLAREVGAPVRVQWTREDDVRHGYYNAVSAQRLRAGLDAAGKLTAWHHRTAFTPIGSTFRAGVDEPSAGDLQQGVLDVPLAIANVRAETCKAKPRARIGWYRSVYNIFHAFALGSFVDELAAARKLDPRDMWIEILGPPRVADLKELGIAGLQNYGESLDRHPVDAGRLRRVVERVTESAKWSDRAGRHLGLAAHRSFVAYTAVVLAVVPDPVRKLRVDEAWIAMDSGTVVNEDRVHAQMEGGLVMGLSNALYGGVTMKAGRVEQSNFRDARICRIRDVPRRIHTDLVRSDGPPCGVGEPPVPPVGAALANAVFALTGQRIRELPIARALGV
ncbi:MAG: xanthine dehydrogenase family protein molybdopterin-binding subunit [Myxococcales bacterium]|nr:xanthine dehydrogenase family protein molybdopterin-binding subunit [Myxococcales bacterium]